MTDNVKLKCSYCDAPVEIGEIHSCVPVIMAKIREIESKIKYVNNWIRINSEKIDGRVMPMQGELVDIFTIQRERICNVIYLYYGDETHFYSPDTLKRYPISEVSHWMPVPFSPYHFRGFDKIGGQGK